MDCIYDIWAYSSAQSPGSGNQYFVCVEYDNQEIVREQNGTVTLIPYSQPHGYLIDSEYKNKPVIITGKPGTNCENKAHYFKTWEEMQQFLDSEPGSEIDQQQAEAIPSFIEIISNLIQTEFRLPIPNWYRLDVRNLEKTIGNIGMRATYIVLAGLAANKAADAKTPKNEKPIFYGTAAALGLYGLFK